MQCNDILQLLVLLHLLLKTLTETSSSPTINSSIIKIELTVHSCILNIDEDAVRITQECKDFFYLS
jgi:hypothetical protein